MSLVWINGRFAEGPVLVAQDRGLLHGWGVFETLLAMGGKLPLLDLHLSRLRHGASRLGIAYEEPANLPEVAAELLQRTVGGDGSLRITLTAGSDVPTWLLTTRKVPTSAPVRLQLGSYRRELLDPTAAIKTTSRAFYQMAAAKALAEGADDVVILDNLDRVLETTKGNLFVVLGGELCTPAWNGAFLAGIARGVLLDAFASSGRPIRERELSLTDLRASDEIYVTNALHGSRPASFESIAAHDDDPLAPVWRRCLGLK